MQEDVQDVILRNKLQSSRKFYVYVQNLSHTLRRQKTEILEDKAIAIYSELPCTARVASI